MEKKTLLVYYSRTGTTKRVAETLARRLACDVEEIQDTDNRRGIPGYLRSCLQLMTGRSARLQPTSKDPGDYDLTIIGTPFWTTVSVPVRTYLTEREGRFHTVAFFATMGGTSGEKAFKVMAALTGSQPIATLSLANRDFDRKQDAQKIEDFAAAIEAAAVNV